MEHFKELIKSLPEPYNKDIQLEKFKQLAELKTKIAQGKSSLENEYYTLRNDIIEHNLKMCGHFTWRFCKKHNRLNEINDIFGECVYSLETALDQYNIESNFTFTTFAYRYMEFDLFHAYEKESRDALFMTDDMVLADDNTGVDIEENPILILPDESESHIAEDFANQEMLNYILNLVEQIPNEQDKLIYKMYYGLGYEKKHSQVELSYILRKSQASISRTILRCEKWILEKLSNEYPSQFQTTKPEVIKFKDTSERDKYIYNQYIGHNGCEKKSISIIAEEVGISYQTASKIIKNMGGTITPEIKHSGIDYSIEFITAVAEDYFGLNGKPILETENILEKYNLSKNSKEYCITIYTTKFCTPNEREKLLKKRKNFFNYKNIKLMAYVYYSHFQNNETYPKIAKDLSLPLEKVSYLSRKYKEFLTKLDKEEQEAILENQ